MDDPINPFDEMIQTADREQLRKMLNEMETLLRHQKNLSRDLGELCIAFSSLDRAVTHLYCPLLKCSLAHATCVASENITPRCTTVIKLLYLEDLPSDWRDWLASLLRRASGELSEARNRYIHDSWVIDQKGPRKIDHRVSVGKRQSRAANEARYDIEHRPSADELERARDKVNTVSMALHVARLDLEHWRSTGQSPKINQQWLDASKPKARYSDFQGYQEVPTNPVASFSYVFD